MFKFLDIENYLSRGDLHWCKADGCKVENLVFFGYTEPEGKFQLPTAKSFDAA